MREMSITHENVRSKATFIQTSASISNRMINFRNRFKYEKLLEIPLGAQCGTDVIVVTIGIDKKYQNSRDSDLRIGLSDGKIENMYQTVDIHNYKSRAPCHPLDAVDDNRLVARGTKAPSTYKFMFSPHTGNTYCETAQEGGYINSGTFKRKLDVSQPLFLRLSSDNETGESYSIHYINVELY